MLNSCIEMVVSMKNVTKVLNITEKCDDTINMLQRQIDEKQKEILFLREKQHSNPGKRFFWGVLETLCFIFSALLLFFCFVASNGSSDDVLNSIAVLIVIGIPSLLLALLFRYFKNMYTVDETILSNLEMQVIELKKELDSVIESKEELIDNTSDNETKERISNDEKECPMCAEIIKKKAKICRYCGYKFDDIS